MSGMAERSGEAADMPGEGKQHMFIQIIQSFNHSIRSADLVDCSSSETETGFKVQFDTQHRAVAFPMVSLHAHMLGPFCPILSYACTIILPPYHYYSTIILPSI